MRLEKLLQRLKGYSPNANLIKSLNMIDQSAIARAWGMSRTVFPQLLAKVRNTSSLKHQRGTGTTITVMTDAVKKKLDKIWIKHKGYLYFNLKVGRKKIAKDKRFSATPKRESIRRWWIKEC